jgi:uncharacterized protein
MTFNIWRFTDGKPGHDSQSIGLCAAIEKLKPSKHFDIPAEPTFDSFRHLLCKIFPAGEAMPDPDLLIGAGHGVHLSMLAARHARGGRAVVLMKPSIPLSLFDVCIVPKHDLVREKANVITTDGAINPVQFNNNKSLDQGMILLGGLSKHYHWDNASIINQVETIITTNPEIKWSIADSPRTPTSILNYVNKQSYKNISILSFSGTSSFEIQKLIFNSNYIWVTRDSVSMIYESLSSGAAVGLIDLPIKKNNRLETSINNLVREGCLALYSEKNTKLALNSDAVIFNEAQRCAELLLNRGILG